MSYLNGKTALQNHKLWSDRFFFPWNPVVKVRGQNSNWNTVKQVAKKKARASVCDVSGATLQSCKVTPAIQSVHDQPKSVRTRPAVVNLLRPVELKIIPQPRILDAWHQWRNTGHVFVTQDILAIFGRLFDRVHIRILTSNFRLWTLCSKAYEIRDCDFRVHFSSVVSLAQNFVEVMYVSCFFPLQLLTPRARAQPFLVSWHWPSSEFMISLVQRDRLTRVSAADLCSDATLCEQGGSTIRYLWTLWFKITVELKWLKLICKFLLLTKAVCLLIHKSESDCDAPEFNMHIWWACCDWMLTGPFDCANAYRFFQQVNTLQNEKSISE